MTGYKLGGTGPTLAQTRIFSATETCNQELGTHLVVTNVSEDGRKFEFRSYSTGTAESERFRQCLRDRRPALFEAKTG